MRKFYYWFEFNLIYQNIRVFTIHLYQHIAKERKCKGERLHYGFIAIRSCL